MIKLILILLLLPSLSFAHESGIALEKNVDDYFVDIAVIPHKLSSILYAKDSVYFEFKLFTADKDKVIQFTDLAVKLKKQGQEVFSDNLKFTGVFYTNYVFEEKGDYTIDVTYKNGELILVQTDFPLTVADSPTPLKRYGAIVLQGLPVIIGWPLVMYYGYKEFKKRRQNENQPTN